jgi:Sortase domain
MAAGRIALVAAVTLLLSTVTSGSEAAEPTNGRGQPATAPVKAPVADSFHSVRTFDQVAEPVRLRIPALHVNSTLDRLPRLADGTVAVPGTPDVAGWYEDGPRPGQPGPAVILGHVDSRKGPGIFFYLDQLKPGADVYVDRADGSTVGFRVTGVSRVPKTQFPTDLVYSPTLEPSLQLITCGGSFDYHARSYRDNVIVYTSPA